MKKDYPDIEALENEKWQDPDPATGKLGTRVPAKWLQLVEDSSKSLTLEVLEVLKEAKIEPNELKNTQLKDAIVAIAAARIINWKDVQNAPKILDVLGDSKIDGASQRIVNVVNTLAKNAETAANLANDKANQAKQEAYDVKILAQSKQDPLVFSGTGNVARMSEVNKKRDLEDNQFSQVHITSPDATLSMGQSGENIRVNITNNNTNNNFYFHDIISKRTIYLPINESSGTIALKSDLPGYYQKLVNMTSQRSPNVTYINNTSAPITIIVVSAMSANLQGSVTVDGVSVPYAATGRNEGARASITVPVPPKGSYSSNDFESFYEVR